MSFFNRLTLSFLLLASISSFAMAADATDPALSVDFSPNLAAGGFNSIDASGYVNVLIKQGKSYNVRISNNPQLPVQLQVRKHTLYVNLSQAPATASQFFQRPTVTVQMPDIKTLKAHGAAQVIGNQIASTGLDIYADGSQFIRLSGSIDLNTINQTGRNVIDVEGIKADNIAVNAHNYGQITLAGQVNRLEARIDGHANLQAKDLLAGTVLVDAKGSALVKVYPLNTLRAFASEMANVSYYHEAQDISRYATQAANILFLGPQP